jgi:hypothetical protein
MFAALTAANVPSPIRAWVLGTFTPRSAANVPARTRAVSRGTTAALGAPPLQSLSLGVRLRT